MGAVTIDIHKKERDFQSLNLSDMNVVKYLILHRNKIDSIYEVNTNNNIYQAGEVFEFNQELITLYASLDKLIEKIKLKDREKVMLKLLFDGNEISDVINEYGYPRKTAYRMFNRIVEKIVNQNNEDWQRVVKSNFL